jgi:hypothetical protein
MISLAVGGIPTSMPVAETSKITDPKEIRPISPIFNALKIGQLVNITNNQSGLIEIALISNGTTGTHKIVEIGQTHIAIEDITGLTRRWIPTTSIIGVSWINLPRSN